MRLANLQVFASLALRVYTELHQGIQKGWGNTKVMSSRNLQVAWVPELTNIINIIRKKNKIALGQ